MENGKRLTDPGQLDLDSEMEMRLHVIRNSSTEVYRSWSAQRRSIGHLVATKNALVLDLSDKGRDTGYQADPIPGQLALSLVDIEVPVGQMTLDEAA